MKKHLLIIGPAGSGKTQIVRGLAQLQKTIFVKSNDAMNPLVPWAFRECNPDTQQVVLDEFPADKLNQLGKLLLGPVMILKMGQETFQLEPMLIIASTVERFGLPTIPPNVMERLVIINLHH